MDNQQIFNDFTNFINIFKIDGLNSNIQSTEDNKTHELENANKSSKRNSKWDSPMAFK